jgi:hypothetical protein
VDIVFVTTQPRADWTFAELQVVNVIDSDPLNIWTGIVTVKTRTGFRVYLNGLPDSGNYYLDWAINGGTVATAGTATTYLLSGPDFGPIGTGTAFTVALPEGTTVDLPVTVTPDDAGNGGVFSPPTVELTSDLPSANFSYTPASYGAKTISVTNDQLLTDPGALSFTAVVTTYLLSGPSGGTVGVPSTNFTVALPVGGVTLNTITVTPTDAPPGFAVIGAFTPATVNLTTAAPSATFTYTPSTFGAKTISVTNNRGLTNPASLSYMAVVNPTTIAGLQLWLKADSLALSDGTAISTWSDSSSNANNATAAGAARPTFKTAIVNGKPIVRTNVGVPTLMGLTSTIGGAAPWTFFVVMKAAASTELYSLFASGGQPVAMRETGTGFLLCEDAGGTSEVANSWTGAFHVFTSQSVAAAYPSIWVDGVLQVTTPVAGAAAPAFGQVAYGTGDIAEMLFYNLDLSTTDRQSLESYLKSKYATP